MTDSRKLSHSSDNSAAISARKQATQTPPPQAVLQRDTDAAISPAQELSRVAMEFQKGFASCLLFAGLELDMFSAIAPQGSVGAEIAGAVGTPPVTTELLLQCMVAASLLEKRGARYFLADRYRPLLTRGDDAYCGELLLLQKNELLKWLNIPDILRSLDHGRDVAEYFDAPMSQTEGYLGGIEVKNRPHADATVQYLRGTLQRAARILDLGGGHGYYARRILQEYRHASVTIVDVENAIRYCQERLVPEVDSARLELAVGDARTLDLDAQFDLVMINDLLHYFNDGEKAETLRRALRALRPGGTLLISKFRLDPSGAAPQFATHFSFWKHVANPGGGYLETDERTVAMLRAAGGEQVHVHALNDVKTLVLAHKSGAAG